MNLDEYVGIPYCDKGRDRRTGLDCWGLLHLIYSERLGIALPSYAENYATAADREATAALIAGKAQPWIQIAEPAVLPLDGLLMLRGGVECHVGIVVKRGLVLHVGLDLNESRIESYRSMRLKRRVSRFMRHRDVAWTSK